ncbi:hypothetical protein FO519_007009 [Halicephalobus sp. NKZ332]|nr:hypothetical protein FO519_007009 [Halicephalobus sp. NKZ332]
MKVLIFLVLLIYFADGSPTSCTCDSTTTTDSPTDDCSVDVEGGVLNMSSTPIGCICNDPGYVFQIGTQVVSGVTYYIVGSIEGSCGTMSLVGGKKTTVKGLLIFGSIWIILWTIGTLITNIVFKAKGHHRILGIVEEVGIIFLFIFLGFFATKPFDMPAIANYILPIPIALIPAVASYFALKKYYALGIHCFISVGSDMLWAFAIPTWILFILAITFGQLAFLACKQYQQEVDRDQLFWAFKCCKGLPILAAGIISLYFLAAFALDMQKLWLIILYLMLCLPFGPAIFIIHTMQYKKTAKGLYQKTNSNVYAPCGDEYYEEPEIPNDPDGEKMPPENPKNPPENEKPPPEDDNEKLSELPASGTKPQANTVSK